MISEAYIRGLSDRIASLEREMADPAVMANHKKVRAVANEHGRLVRTVALGEKYFRVRREIDEHRALLADASADADLKQLATDEIGGLEQSFAAAEKELVVALVPPEPNDSRNAIFEIRAGTGGEEAALFAADLFRMYSRYAESQGWKVGIIDASSTNIGGYKEVVFSVEGNGAYGMLKYESGGHRVQRVPATEAQGRVHTSAANVGVLPEVEPEDEIVVPAEELRIDIFRSSGPGGQCVNTTSSAVRITHLPTGMVSQSQDERSQHRNREKAMRVLLARIMDARRTEETARVTSEKRTLMGSGDRSQRVRTYNFPQNRLTDHRAGFTLYNLDKIVDGGLQPVIDALREQDLALRLGKATGGAAQTGATDGSDDE